MPLQDLFNKQIESLRAFLGSSQPSLGIVTLAPDLKPIFLRLLTGFDADPSFPHLLIGIQAPCVGAPAYLAAVGEALRAEITTHRAALARFGIVAPDDTATHKSAPAPDAAAALQAEGERLVSSLEPLLRGLPAGVRSLVLVLYPSEVADPSALTQALSWLAAHAPRRRCKFLVVDDGARLTELPGRLAEGRSAALAFAAATSEIEAQVRRDLAAPGLLSALEQRQYTALLAGFAFAHKRYDEALSLHQQARAQLLDQASAEAAVASYNIGNVHLARGELAEAERAFGQATAVCLDLNLASLLPLILCNLSLCLQGQEERAAEALRCLELARGISVQQGLRPLEAHVLDALGRLHAAAGRPAEAKRHADEARALVDSWRSEFVTDIRDAARAGLGPLAADQPLPVMPPRPALSVDIKV
jgi:tetratricopeptide (TPR) repeat protein